MGTSAPDNIRRLVDHFDRESGEHQISATGKSIDALVYELNRLAEAGIKAIDEYA